MGHDPRGKCLPQYQCDKRKFDIHKRKDIRSDRPAARRSPPGARLRGSPAVSASGQHMKCDMASPFFIIGRHPRLHPRVFAYLFSDPNQIAEDGKVEEGEKP
ncbi:hypothetical protein [Xanthobacter pseudotagetidis]|uniref:hypothetical protein n=1 Tax=Xanthobacter pseudotagetidis TaxID=3119911 RepID=UPI0037264090